MSRAYRIQVKETVEKIIRAEDHVSAELEMLDILPCEQMADLLAAELAKLGFKREGDSVSRSDGETVVRIDVSSGTIEVRRESATEVSISGSKTGRGYDDAGPNSREVKRRISKQLREELEDGVDQEQRQLQQSVTDALEAELSDLRQELDRAVNNATAEALKQKAAQIGQIKELTEEPESGSLTIVLEV